MKYLKLKLQGTGGMWLAAKETGINYFRLSRIVNGWVTPKDSELALLEEYLRERTKKILELGQGLERGS